MEDYSFISSLAKEAVEAAEEKKEEKSSFAEKVVKEVEEVAPSYIACGDISMGKWGEEVNTPTLTPPTPPKTQNCTSPLVEVVPPSPIISSSRRAGARRMLRKQEKRKSQENARSGRTEIESLVGIRAVGVHDQESVKEGVATNCDRNRVENQNCDIIENNFDQGCSQSLLEKQVDEEDFKAEGDGDKDGDDDKDGGETGQVVEDQLSLEEWGEDDLRVRK